ncbi:MAG: hypothetical protein CFE21_17105 [Bacteroidetes bacterium B1(2017)]|nr:MAG: hypothetical protein CFE21_17105 [Bacteroidetes bacterium B1(2017)]
MIIIKMVKISVLIISILVFSCHLEQKSVFLECPENKISIEIDSVCLPEIAIFPIRLKIANFNDNKVVLQFNSDTSDSYKRLNNMFLISKTDTFDLWLGDKYLILNERSVTSFTCRGIYNSGRGHFNSIKDFQSFNKLKLIYLGENNYKSNFKYDFIYKTDTFLIPKIIIGNADNVKIVSFFQGGSFSLIERSIDSSSKQH